MCVQNKIISNFCAPEVILSYKKLLQAAMLADTPPPFRFTNQNNLQQTSQTMLPLSQLAKKRAKKRLSLLVAQMLKKITTEEAVGDGSTSELDALKHRDWVRRYERGHSVTGRTMQQCV